MHNNEENINEESDEEEILKGMEIGKNPESVLLTKKERPILFPIICSRGCNKEL